MAALGQRQDKPRRIIIEPESSIGVLETLSGGGGRIVPALSSSRIGPMDVEMISQAEALDGYAGEVAGTRGAAGMGGPLAVEVRDYSPSSGDAACFVPWNILLLACGFEATHSTKTLTLFPSTKPVTDWPGETAGARSPLALTVGEVMFDNGTADELVPMRGAVGSAKLRMATNDRFVIEAALKGLVAGSEFVDVDTADLSGYGTRVSNESVDPLVIKGTSITAQYRDDSGDTSVSLVDLRGLEVDMQATVERVVDPTAAEGYGVPNPYHDSAPSVTLQFADTAALAEDLLTGYRTGRGFIRVQVTIALSNGGSIVVNIPRIQYEPQRQTQGARRTWSLNGKAVRGYAGDSAAPITIAYTYGT